MSIMNSAFPSVSSGEHIESSERLSDIIIPPSDYYQHPSNYLHPNPVPTKRESPSRAGQEHDSGVVADRDSDGFSRQISQISSPSGGGYPPPPDPQFYPPGPDTGDSMPIKRRPESLAVRGHEYEELPTSRQQAMDYSSSGDHMSQQGPPLFSKLNSVQSNHTGSNDQLLFNAAPPLPVYRKRENPLYESNDHDDPECDSVSKKAPPYKPGCPCLCPCLFMVVLISLIALCMSLYTFTTVMWHPDSPQTAMVISPHNHSASDMMDYMEKLQSQNALLEDRVRLLEALVQTLENNMSIQLSVLDEVKQRVESHQVNTETRFIQLSSQVQNVTKMEGPQGPAGSGNLSRCVHLKKSSGGSSFEDFTETIPIPVDSQQDTEVVIMGVECTTDGGRYALLKVLNDLPFTQYLCQCSGQASDSVNSRQCEMHYWSCPKIS